MRPICAIFGPKNGQLWDITKKTLGQLFYLLDINKIPLGHPPQFETQTCNFWSKKCPTLGHYKQTLGQNCYLLDKLKIPLGQAPQFETHSCHFWPKKCPTLGHNKKTLGQNFYNLDTIKKHWDTHLNLRPIKNLWVPREVI